MRIQKIDPRTHLAVKVITAVNEKLQDKNHPLSDKEKLQFLNNLLNVLNDLEKNFESTDDKIEYLNSLSLENKYIRFLTKVVEEQDNFAINELANVAHFKFDQFIEFGDDVKKHPIKVLKVDREALKVEGEADVLKAVKEKAEKEEISNLINKSDLEIEDFLINACNTNLGFLKIVHALAKLFTKIEETDSDIKSAIIQKLQSLLDINTQNNRSKHISGVVNGSFEHNSLHSTYTTIKKSLTEIKNSALLFELNVLLSKGEEGIERIITIDSHSWKPKRNHRGGRGSGELNKIRATILNSGVFNPTMRRGKQTQPNITND